MIGAHASLSDHVHDAGCLATDLRRLGLPEDRDLLIHSAVSQIGWIEGGAEALISAIRSVTGNRSTIVVPTFTTINSPTSRSFRNQTLAMSDRERADFIERLPGFDPDRRVSEMGLVADYFLGRDDAVRSPHPLVSFTAVGPRAAEFMSIHDLDSHFGERSPLGALYKSDALILLLGVGYDSCSTLHYAEYRLPEPPMRTYTCFMVEAGRRVSKEFATLDLYDGDFIELGEHLEKTVTVDAGLVGGASSKIISMRAAVGFAIAWMIDNRSIRHPIRGTANDES